MRIVGLFNRRRLGSSFLLNGGRTMAIAKGPKMIEEMIRKRAEGMGFKTIAQAHKISKNTVKKHLVAANAYEVEDAKKKLQSGFSAPAQTQFSPFWSSLIAWNDALNNVESGQTIKDFWDIHFASSLNQDLKNIPYETFWREFRRRFPCTNIYYHKNHEPGQRCEIDYKGDTPGLGFFDKSTGEFIECRLFGNVLCNSRMFFPFATLDEKQGSWLAGIQSSFEYFGGVTELLVVDNTRCAVDRADWFDPDINQEFFNFCAHMGTTVVAARPRRPKDKNLIEVHLGVFWRWIRFRLKQLQFFSLGELNRFLETEANVFNSRFQRKYGSSRRERFNLQEKSMLKSLPLQAYETGEWRKAKLHEDGHIQLKYNFYSAPFQHRGKELDVRCTLNHVEIFFQQERIALHARRPDHQRGLYSTHKEHLPQKFQAMEEISILRQIAEAKKIGPNVEKIIRETLTESTHPFMYLRRSMGILRLKGRFGSIKLDRACEVLVKLGCTKPKVRDIERMLQNRMLEDKPQIVNTERKPNPHLHGQLSFKTEGENIYESGT